MRTDLGNQVIARIDDETRQVPRRSLDLGNIFTPELGLLSPHRSEIAPRGRARDAALIAYSERLRQSYRANEAGIRDGMLKLGEAYRQGQTIAVSCFCRAGGLCHADVVKLAIEKVAGSLAREAERQKSQGVIEQTANTIQPNPRTERAVNEILSVSKSDLILSKLEDTEGRNRSEHASHLNGHSQFVRDLYERGAVVRDGVLISPKDNASSSAPLGITTAEYALKRLEPIVNESRAKEIVPQLLEYGNRIAGDSADRDTKIKVFNWIYGALEGRNDLLKTEDKASVNESKEERFERTLEEISVLAGEMERLEPTDRLVAVESLDQDNDVANERAADELSFENVYENAFLREENTSLEHDHAVGGIQEFERTELQDTTLARLADEMSKDELNRWIEVRLPVIDEMLESGTPVDSILKPFQNEIYQAAKEDGASKQTAIDDLRFASGYIRHQLKQPESRLRHFNARYREYALMLEKAVSREELIDAASKIRHENAKLGFGWEKLSETEKAATPRPLTSKEMQFLFTEASPRHYTSEMTAARLAYSNAGESARTKTDSLMRGEIDPSKEAMQLIGGLESRLERRNSTDSLSATKHFLKSLKTPNDELRYKNAFDHSEVYRKLPPAERDYVYQRAVLQKDHLEEKLIDSGPSGRTANESARVENASAAIGKSFREALKSDLVDLLRRDPRISGSDLSEMTSRIVEKHVEMLGSKAVSDTAVRSWGRELGDGVSKRLHESMSRSNRSDGRDQNLPKISSTRVHTEEHIYQR